MNDLVAFLVARLDEEAAQGVQDRSEPWPGQWEAEGDNAVRTYNGWVLVWGKDLAPGLVEHIARHDPARALREVAAKRARLAVAVSAWAELDRLRADPAADDAEKAVALACVAVAIVAVENDAAVYSDHPDYREEWKP